MENTVKPEYSGTLRVTDGCLDTYRKFARFMPETLPRNAIVVNVGGGENQTFEKDLAAIRPRMQKLLHLIPAFMQENRSIKQNSAPLDIYQPRKPVRELMFYPTKVEH